MDVRILTAGWLDAPSKIDCLLLVGFLRFFVRRVVGAEFAIRLNLVTGRDDHSRRLGLCIPVPDPQTDGIFELMVSPIPQQRGHHATSLYADPGPGGRGFCASAPHGD